MVDLMQIIGSRDAASVAGWRDGGAVSCEALLARADAWRALALRSPGTSVALYVEDSLEFSAALLGAWQAGKTVWLAADVLEHTCAALALSVDAFFGDFPADCAALVPAPNERTGLAAAALSPDLTGVVVHTSGSTGQAQAIPKRLGQLFAEVTTLESLFGPLAGACTVVATVSHQHIYGLLFKVLWPLMAGRPMVAASLAYPEQLVVELARRPCMLVASPAHLKRLPAQLAWQGAAAQLRMVFSSGGPLAPEVADASARLLGRVPTEIYGSSETGGIAWRRRGAAGTGAWTALPGVTWRRSADGLLELQSAHLGTAGWMQLADRIEPAGAQAFFLTGRSDRIVKIEEKRISLDAIEAALLATGLAGEARVIAGPPSSGQRQVLAAFVVLTADGRSRLRQHGKHAMNSTLRAALAKSTEAVALPRRWRYLESMPADAQGKTTQAQLIALLGAAIDTRPRVPQISTIESSESRVLLAVTIPASLFYFDGHFREAPVLPGVVQVDWAILYGRRHFTLGASFRAIHGLKFQQVIRADMTVQLELTHDHARDSLAFRYFSDAGQHAGGRILFGS